MMRFITLPMSELVKQRQGRAVIFDRLGLDYCSAGYKTLAEACYRRGVDVYQVVEELARADELSGEQHPADMGLLTLGELCDYLVEHHHGYLRREMPRIEQLLDHVVEHEGKAHPEVMELRTIFQRFAEEMKDHMAREERHVFPMIHQLEAAMLRGEPKPLPVEASIGLLELEHDQAALALLRMRELLRDYDLPDHASEAYRRLIEAMRALEHDLHLHVHLENYVLFPKTREMHRLAALTPSAS